MIETFDEEIWRRAVVLVLERNGDGAILVHELQARFDGAGRDLHMGQLASDPRMNNSQSKFIQ